MWKISFDLSLSYAKNLFWVVSGKVRKNKQNVKKEIIKKDDKNKRTVKFSSESTLLYSSLV